MNLEMKTNLEGFQSSFLSYSIHFRQDCFRDFGRLTHFFPFCRVGRIDQGLLGSEFANCLFVGNDDLYFCGTNESAGGEGRGERGEKMVWKEREWWRREGQARGKTYSHRFVGVRIGMNADVGDHWRRLVDRFKALNRDIFTS